MDRIAPYFRPEFLNRFNGIIEFSHLTKEDLKDIVNLMLDEVSETIAKKGIDLVVSDAAKEHLMLQSNTLLMKVTMKPWVSVHFAVSLNKKSVIKSLTSTLTTPM